MIAQHFIFESHKPEVLKDAFNEAAALWKKNGAKEVSLWRLQGTKINHFSFLLDAKTWKKSENAWITCSRY